jgi:NAD/NADP transhydrogenase alpha subunit
MSKVIIKSSKVYRNCLLNLVKDIVNKEPLDEYQKDSIISKIDLIIKQEPIIELEK